MEKLTHTVMGSRCPSGECTNWNIFKFTVSKHCDAAKQQQLVLWIEKQLKVKLTENKPGQSKTCTRKIDMSAEFWPGIHAKCC
eukprot:jgi/Tetstr1/464631/TSEL_009385.t1